MDPPFSDTLRQCPNAFIVPLVAVYLCTQGPVALHVRGSDYSSGQYYLN